MDLALKYLFKSFYLQYDKISYCIVEYSLLL